MERFAKIIMSEGRCATRNFAVEGGGEVLSKTPEKEAPQENIVEFFLIDTLKTTF